MMMENIFIITGDTLLESSEVITSFRGGNIDEYKENTMPFLYSLPPIYKCIARRWRYI